MRRTSERTVTSQKAGSQGQQFVFRNALVIGDECMTNVRFPEHLFSPKEGTEVAYVCEVTAYQGRPEITAVREIDLSGGRRAAAPPESAPAPAAAKAPGA